MKFLYKSESYSLPQQLFFIPLKDLIVFPYVVTPLFFQSDEALTILNQAFLENGFIGCVSQRELHEEDPSLAEINELKEKVRASGLPQVEEIASKEIGRLERARVIDEHGVLNRLFEFRTSN